MEGQLQIPCTEITTKEQKKTASQSLVWTAITMTDAVWKPGDKGTITITFGGYNCDSCSPDAAWSQIGKHSNDNFPSMNLGFIDPPYGAFTLNGVSYTAPASEARNYCGNTSSTCKPGWIPGATVIHEFGHALGMLHEHQNNLENSNPIKLKRDSVVKYYDCIGMGESGAVTNVLDSYECTPGVDCDYAGTKFDPKSIMLYALPNEWIQGCPSYSSTDCQSILRSKANCGSNPTSPNFKLSSQDISWLQQQYPKSSTDQPEITVKFIDQNHEPWKVAWVQKMITETYGPLLGIKWNFETQNILKSQTSNGTNSPTKSSTNSPTQKPKVNVAAISLKLDSEGNVEGTKLKPDEYLSSIIVPVIIGIIFLILFLMYIWPGKDRIKNYFYR